MTGLELIKRYNELGRKLEVLQVDIRSAIFDEHTILEYADVKREMTKLENMVCNQVNMRDLEIPNHGKVNTSESDIIEVKARVR